MQSLSKLEFSGSEHILDVGCGDGKITARISERVAEGSVIGLDMSWSMVDFSSSSYTPALFPNLSFIQGDAAQLTFNDEFDLIVSFCCLNWVSEQKMALTGIYNALKSKGQALIVVPARCDTNLGAYANLLAQSPKWSVYFPVAIEPKPLFTAEEYRTLLDEVGFNIISVEAIPNSTSFQNMDEVKDWLRPLSKHLKMVPDERKEEFLNELVALYIDPSCYNADGSIIPPMVKLEAIIRK